MRGSGMGAPGSPGKWPTVRGSGMGAPGSPGKWTTVRGQVWEPQVAQVNGPQ